MTAEATATRLKNIFIVAQDNPEIKPCLPIFLAKNVYVNHIFILLRGSENDWSPPEDDPGHLSNDSAEPESEIPVARWNQDLPDGSPGWIRWRLWSLC